MKQYLIDTNCILRYLLDDNPQQADKIEDFFMQAKENKIRITVSILVFVELIFALKKFYNYSKAEIIEKLTPLAEFTYLDIEKRELLLQAFSLYCQANISFVDTILCVEAKMGGRQLLTFDRKLGELIKTKTI